VDVVWGNTVAITLNFVNNSNDVNNSHIIVFQKNLAGASDDGPIAWKVIGGSRPGETYPFAFPVAMEVAVADDAGKTAGPMAAANGQHFVVGHDHPHYTLTIGPTEANAAEVQVRNALPDTSITASIYRDGRLLAIRAGVLPQQMAVFSIKPSVWIGVAPDVAEGQVIDGETLANVNTELSLLGLASADIIMSGGWPGVSSTPFRFSLQNVVMA
ncbi:MAG: hypothetical protein WCS75_07310, partial [Sphingomonas sp.]|jgi:hypothetical protein